MVVFVFIGSFLITHAAPVPKNPTLAEWLKRGAIPKFVNGVFVGLLTNKDIQKIANDNAATLKKKSDAANGNIYRPKPAFDRLQWEAEEAKRRQDNVPVPISQHSSIPIAIDCDAVALRGLEMSCKSFSIAIGYVNCKNNNNFRSSSIVPIVPIIKSCADSFSTCVNTICPDSNGAMGCVRNFYQCVMPYARR